MILFFTVFFVMTNTMAFSIGSNHTKRVAIEEETLCVDNKCYNVYEAPGVTPVVVEKVDP